MAVLVARDGSGLHHQAEQAPGAQQEPADQGEQEQASDDVFAVLSHPMGLHPGLAAA